MGKNLALDETRVVLEPRTLAKMLNALDINNDELVLDIGTGLGYSSAVIARMAEAVVAVEDDETRADDAQSILAEQNVDNVVVHTGALVDGSAAHGPYDVILVQGGVEDVPADLTAQLKEGGRIACLFMTGALGEMRIGHKLDGDVIWRPVFNAGAPVLQGFERAREFAL